METIGLLLIWLLLSATAATALFMYDIWPFVSASDHPHQAIGYGLVGMMVMMIAASPVYLPVSLIVIGYFSYRRMRRRALDRGAKL